MTLFTLAAEIRLLSKTPKEVLALSFSSVEQLTCCLEHARALDDEDIEYLLLVSLSNILLLNKDVLMILVMAEHMPIYSRLFSTLLMNSRAFIEQKKPDLYSVLANDANAVLELQKIAIDIDFRDSKLFTSVREIKRIIPNVRLFFLLCCYRVPAAFVPQFFNDLFDDLSFVFTVFTWDVFQEVNKRGDQGTEWMDEMHLLLIEIFKTWYAFSCNYEDQILRIPHNKFVTEDGAGSRYLNKYLFYLDHLAEFGDYYLMKYRNQAGDGNLSEIEVKTALNIGSLILIPDFAIYEKWVNINGIQRLYPLYVLYLNLLCDTLGRINYDEMYSRSAENFSFVNLEVMPAAAIVGHLLSSSNRYDTGSHHDNKTNNIYYECFSGVRNNDIPPEYVGCLPNIKPMVEMALREPLLVKLNKELLKIYQKLGIEVLSSHISLDTDVPLLRVGISRSFSSDYEQALVSDAENPSSGVPRQLQQIDANLAGCGMEAKNRTMSQEADEIYNLLFKSR